MDKFGHTPLTHDQKELALLLFDIGAVEFAGPGKPGWPLRQHENEPDRELSPVYFNLRTADNPKPGPLTDEHLKLIAVQLHRTAYDLEYDFVIGIPNAGDPIAKAFVQTAPLRMVPQRRPFVGMEKHHRRIVGLRVEDLPPRRGLPIDDVVTGANSMINAIEKLRDQKITVEHCLTVFDRQQGGAALLRKMGAESHSVYKLANVLQLYHDTGRITWPTLNGVLEYITRNQFA